MLAICKGEETEQTLRAAEKVRFGGLMPRSSGCRVRPGKTLVRSFAITKGGPQVRVGSEEKSRVGYTKRSPDECGGSVNFPLSDALSG